MLRLQPPLIIHPSLFISAHVVCLIDADADEDNSSAGRIVVSHRTSSPSTLTCLLSELCAVSLFLFLIQDLICLRA